MYTVQNCVKFLLQLNRQISTIGNVSVKFWWIGCHLSWSLLVKKNLTQKPALLTSMILISGRLYAAHIHFVHHIWQRKFVLAFLGNNDGYNWIEIVPSEVSVKHTFMTGKIYQFRTIEIKEIKESNDGYCLPTCILFLEYLAYYSSIWACWFSRVWNLGLIYKRVSFILLSQLLFHYRWSCLIRHSDFS